MTVTLWLMAALLVAAAGLCVWAALTGTYPLTPPERVSRHGRWVGEGATRRLPALADAPTEIIPAAVARGRCTCLHLAHIGRCRAAGCDCYSVDGFTAPTAVHDGRSKTSESLTPQLRMTDRCRCDWLGEGTPEHETSPMCRALRPDGPRDAG